MIERSRPGRRTVFAGFGVLGVGLIYTERIGPDRIASGVVFVGLGLLAVGSFVSITRRGGSGGLP